MAHDMTMIGQQDMWCILRTSGGRTLPVARSLAGAGLTVWTPTQVTQRLVRRGRTKVKREVAVPILPTFVFAAAGHLSELASITADPLSPHPPFSIFSRASRVPLVRAGDVAALRQAEADAEAAIQAVRDADTREDQRKARAALLRTEHARRKALRAERRDLAIGTVVDVVDAPALAGLAGRVIESSGTAAVVSFGGSLVMRIEAWRLLPHGVDGRATDAA